MPKRNYTHGGYKSRLYNIWLNMKQRCLNPNNIHFKKYGGRGIEIYERWKNDFSEFRNWAFANGYDENLTIDRIDNNSNYVPENCRWISNIEQQSNRRDNRILTLNGESKTMSQWAREKKISFKALQKRVDSGWNIEDSLNTPILPKLKNIKGEKFGRLLVVELDSIGSHGAIWKCLCDCGTLKSIRGNNLKSGMTKSCGCIQKEVAKLMLTKKQIAI